MKRPFKDIRPLGPFAQANVQGSSNSSYNYTFSQCDKELCFNGMTKKEALQDIVNVYKHVSKVAPERYKEINVDIDRVTIVGSVATGNFGCRDMKKIEKIYEEEMRMFFDGRALAEARDLIDDASSVRELNQAIHEMKSEVSDPMIEDMLFTLEDNLCSDIDMFMPADIKESVLMDLQENSEFREIQDGLITEANEMSNLNMVFEPGVRAKEVFEADSEEEISSVDELKSIIQDAP